MGPIWEVYISLLASNEAQELLANFQTMPKYHHLLGDGCAMWVLALRPISSSQTPVIAASYLSIVNLSRLGGSSGEVLMYQTSVWLALSNDCSPTIINFEGKRRKI